MMCVRRLENAAPDAGDGHPSQCSAIPPDCGETVSEADVRLMPTAVRFDGIYASIFRCGRFQIRANYPNVERWTKEMLTLTGPDLFDLQDARKGYYSDLFPLNPGGIVPAGPSPADLGWRRGAERDRPAVG